MTLVRRGTSWAHVVATSLPSVEEEGPVPLADAAPTQNDTLAEERPDVRQASEAAPGNSIKELVQELHNVTSESISTAVTEGNQGSRVIVEKARQLYLQLVERMVPVVDIMNIILNACEGIQRDTTESAYERVWNVKFRYAREPDMPWELVDAKEMRLPGQFAIGRISLCSERGIDVKDHLGEHHRAELTQISRVQVIVMIVEDYVCFVDIASLEGTTLIYGKGYSLGIAQSIPGARQVMKVHVSQLPVKVMIGNESVEVEMDLRL